MMSRTAITDNAKYCSNENKLQCAEALLSSIYFVN